MKITLATTLVLGLFTLSTSAQDLPNILSDQICECLEKENITNIEDADVCYEQAIVKNLDKLYDYYNVKSLDDINFETIGNEIGVILINECDYMMPYFTNPINKFEEDFVPEKNLDCSGLRSGDYYYLNPNILTKMNDTTYVTIKDKMYLERFDAGRKYALLDINWTSDCKFDLEFKNSNDSFKTEMSKKEELHSYEVVESTPQSYILKMQFKAQDYKFELFAIE